MHRAGAREQNVVLAPGFVLRYLDSAAKLFPPLVAQRFGLFAAVAVLESPSFAIGGHAVTWTELFGFVTGVLCVWLVARQHAWNWPIGIAKRGAA